MAFQWSIEFEAIKHDINTLFSNFKERQSVRFEDFCKEWRNLNFTCIFGATELSKPNSRMRMVERLFRVSSEFLSEECTFLYRVAAVYTFYAVYFKQITKAKVKIRLTPAMWKDLLELLNISKEHQHYDVAYVIEILRKEKAFIFCAFPKELLFGKIEFMLRVEGSARLYHHEEKDNYFSNDLDKFQQKLSDIQKDYNDVKKKVMDESTEEQKSKLSKVIYYSQPGYSEEVGKMLNAHKKIFAAGSLMKQNDDILSVQRPVLSQLQDLDQDKNKTEESSLTMVDSEVKRLSKFKEKIWSADIKKNKKSRYAPETVRIEEPKKDTKKGKEKDTRYYKRSAMMLPVKERTPSKVIKKPFKYCKGTMMDDN